MLFRDGLRDTIETPDGGAAPAPSNDRGIVGPTRPQLDELQRGCAAVEHALESIAAPAFLVERTGAVLQTNAAGRCVLATDAVSVAASLAAAVVAERSPDDWLLSPLSKTDTDGPVLAVLRARSPRPATADPIQKARLRWRLTARQTEVLDLVARGLTNALVAETLNISEGTVEYHLTALFDKAGVCNRTTLIVRLLELGRR